MYHCDGCLKSYRHSPSLSRHKRTCRQKLDTRGRAWKSSQDRIKDIGTRSIDDSTEDKMSGKERKHEREEVFTDSVDRVGSYSLNSSESMDESNMDIYNNSELESDGSSDDDKDEISSYSLNTPVIRRHSIWLPPNTRAIIVGKSGCGKTTLLSHLLMCPDVMEYDNLVVCGRSLHQPEYRIMQRGFDMGLSNTQIGCLFRMKDKMRERCGSIDQFLDEYSGICKGNADAVFIDDVTAIPDPCENDTRKKNLLVLDDVMLSPQNKVEAYFTRGRHNNVDVIYITQSYFRLPRQTIRENGNMFIFFKQDQKNLTHIFNDHCAGDGIPFQEFCNWCNDVWQKGKYNFVTIDLTRPVEFGKYRKNLKDFWLNSNFRK